MKSLPLTLRELEKDKTLALCLYHTGDHLQYGVCVEVRLIKDGSLLSEPIVVRDRIILSEKPIDALDRNCAAILEKVRLIRNRN